MHWWSRKEAVALRMKDLPMICCCTEEKSETGISDSSTSREESFPHGGLVVLFSTSTQGKSADSVTSGSYFLM